MRILVMNVHFTPYTYSGATVVAEELAFALRTHHGAEVFVISSVSRPDLPAYAIQRVEVQGMAHFMINLPWARTIQEIESNPRVAERVSQIVQFVQPDIAHVHCVQDLGAASLAALKAAGIPVVLSVHDFWWVCERQFMIRPNGQYCGQDPIRIDRCRGCVDDVTRTHARNAMLGQVAASCDLITYPTHFAMDLCLRSGLGDPSRSVVLENGIKPPGPDFAAKQAAHRAAGKPFTFGYLGGPSDAKGWPMLRRAMLELGRDDFEFHIVNGSPWSNWWDGHDLSKLHGTTRIIPRFSQDRIDDFFAGIDCLLFLSQWKETFGLTIREAISRGIRVIQTDSGGTVDHPMADPLRLIPLGQQTNRLKAELIRVLDTPDAHPAPVAVHTYRQQSDALVRLAQSVMTAAKGANT
ncbi:glycosyltransferase [Pseudotabrizicola sp.]|uniref:glycosyltransferase n=1 Tax=Pseudotabrizicola sp. TaxID=2939647 RepID=UPI002720522A|nr:glycosyltransferase [Pseudotabrizicola sp.]MDO8882904.1 glycosyltransferase [Pseudotabrizicola sp.]